MRPAMRWGRGMRNFPKAVKVATIARQQGGGAVVMGRCRLAARRRRKAATSQIVPPWLSPRGPIRAGPRPARNRSGFCTPHQARGTGALCLSGQLARVAILAPEPDGIEHRSSVAGHRLCKRHGLAGMGQGNAPACVLWEHCHVAVAAGVPVVRPPAFDEAIAIAMIEFDDDASVWWRPRRRSDPWPRRGVLADGASCKRDQQSSPPGLQAAFAGVETVPLRNACRAGNPGCSQTQHEFHRRGQCFFQDLGPPKKDIAPDRGADFMRPRGR